MASWYQSRRRGTDAHAQPPPSLDENITTGTLGNTDEQEKETSPKFTPLETNVTEEDDNQQSFQVVKFRAKGDYLDVPSTPYLSKILQRQGDSKVLFADRVLKFTGTGKMKRRILLMTDFAIYIVDPETGALKRRIALAAVEKICSSELSDNFFAIIIPTEYDMLIASTRKTEIITMLMEATETASGYELEAFSSNSFEYNAAADLVKEIIFEEVEGGIKTRITSK